MVKCTNTNTLINIHKYKYANMHNEVGVTETLWYSFVWYSVVFFGFSSKKLWSMASGHLTHVQYILTAECSFSWFGDTV